MTTRRFSFVMAIPYIFLFELCSYDSKINDDIFCFIYQDVWFVTNYQVIQWMKKPTTLDNLDRFAEWGCNNRRFTGKEKVCSAPNVCRLSSKDTLGEHYFHTCSQCPSAYPWIRNEFGLDDPSVYVEGQGDAFNPAIQKKK